MRPPHHDGLRLRISARPRRPRPPEFGRSKFGRKAGGLALLVALAASSNPGSAAAGSARDTVQGLYNTLLVTMKNGSTLGESGRYAQLAPVIRRSFDLPIMARLSVGPTWVELTPAQQQQVTESHGRYVSAIYADRFDSYNGPIRSYETEHDQLTSEKDVINSENLWQEDWPLLPEAV